LLNAGACVSGNRLIARQSDSGTDLILSLSKDEAKIFAETIKRTIADGVTAGNFGYAARNAEGRLDLIRFGESFAESEVEISDDVFILRPDDAKKLVEPPRLERLTISPSNADVRPGEHVAFRACGLDQYGQPYQIQDVKWSAAGCSISAEGVLSASDPGRYVVEAQAGGLRAVASVHVEEEKAPEKKKEKVGGKIKWSGDIPPRKWTTFYTKVIAKFASAPGFTVRVSFEAPAPDHAATKISELKSSLRDLGLDENIEA
jgi:hypothetical protein